MSGNFRKIIGVFVLATACLALWFAVRPAQDAPLDPWEIPAFPEATAVISATTGDQNPWNFRLYQQNIPPMIPAQGPRPRLDGGDLKIQTEFAGHCSLGDMHALSVTYKDPAGVLVTKQIPILFAGTDLPILSTPDFQILISAHPRVPR